MHQRNKSTSKLALPENSRNGSFKKKDSVVKGKIDQTPPRSKSNRSLNTKSSASILKSQGKEQRLDKQNKHRIEKQFTKSTFRRFQQKLSIFTRIEELIGQIRDRESKLKSYFEIYRILQSQIGQQRCLQHNNDLSLYCQTQNKVLCVHCVYGQNKHKTHKVIPLKDCIKDVSKDIITLEQTIKKDLDGIKIKIKTSESNQKFIERHYRQQLQELEKTYAQKLKEIQVEFCERKKYIKDYFQSLISKNLELTNTLRQFEKNVNIKLSLLRKDQNNVRHNIKQISRQTILSKMAELSNLQGMVIQDVDQKDIGYSCLKNRIKTSKA